MSQEEFMNSPMKFGGVLSPAFDIAGVMIQEIKDENKEYLTEALQQDLEEAKAKGVNAVREFVSIPNVKSLINYSVQPMYKETVLKMLNNEFNSFDEMLNYDESNAKKGERIYLLMRQIADQSQETNIIESIFYNAK